MIHERECCHLPLLNTSITADKENLLASYIQKAPIGWVDLPWTVQTSLPCFQRTFTGLKDEETAIMMLLVSQRLTITYRLSGTL